MELRVIDTHVHVEQLKDLTEAVERAKRRGVSGIIAVGCDVASNERIRESAQAFPGYVFPGLGLHPWALKEDEAQEALGYMRERVGACVALGEVGLDYKVRCPRELQQRVFRKILDLAKDHGKPVLIHGRAAWEDAVSFAKDSGVERAVFHWYSGPNDVLDEIIRAGFFISATPAAAYSEGHRKAIERVPLENLLLETDSPVSYRGKTAEPADALVSLRCVAEIKGITASEVAERTTENAVAFFALP